MSLTSGWLPTAAGCVWAALHTAPGPTSGTVVVLAPPFGWEGMAAGRQLRGWASRLAAAGYPVLRHHPPGTGDSERLSTEPDLDDRVAALAGAVRHARDLTGCTRATVVGLGLGGLTALQAVDRGCPVDDVVLWSVPSRGRLLLREITAFAALTVEADDAGATESDDSGVLWAHGYPLTARAQQQLRDLDVGALDLGRLRRALVLGRGTLPPDATLVAALERAGVPTDTSPGHGYAELTLEPRLARPAPATERLVQDWLRPGERSEPQPWPAAVTRQREVAVGDVSAVVHEASEPVQTVVFVGAGAIPRSGPNRLWTDAALRWAERGVTSWRLDLPGIGEAPGDDTWPTGPEGFYVEPYRAHLRTALDAVGTDRLLAVGLCSGGYWALQAALTDRRVTDVCLLNPAALVWPPPLQRLGARGRLQHLTSKDTWDQLLHDPASRRDNLGRVGRTVELRLGLRRTEGSGRPGTTREALLALDRLGARVTLGLSPGEQLLADIDPAAQGTSARVVRFDGPPGAHTLAPAVLRAAAARLVDEAVAAAVNR